MTKSHKKFLASHAITSSLITMSGFAGFDFSTAAVADAKNVVTPAGITVPVINAGALRKWGMRDTGTQATIGGSTLVLQRLVFPPGSDDTHQLNYLAYALKDVTRDSPLDTIEKLANLADFLVVGCMGTMFDCRVNDVPVDPDMFRVYGRREDATGAPILNPAQLATEVAALPPDDQWTSFSLTPVTQREATALFALCAYCVVKAPTQLNQTAFTAARPLAAARGAGLAAYPPHLLPTVADLALINNALQQDRRARIPFATCLVSWATTRSVNAQQTAMASQASLWRDQGFGGLKLSRSLVLGYGPAIQRVARLRAQLPAFEEHWEAYSTCTSPLRAYYGAIFGPTNPIAARDDYSLLTLLARDIAQDGFAAGRGMRNFGAGRTVPAEVKTQFENACRELGLTLTP